MKSTKPDLNSMEYFADVKLQNPEGYKILKSAFPRIGLYCDTSYDLADMNGWPRRYLRNIRIDD